MNNDHKFSNAQFTNALTFYVYVPIYLQNVLIPEFESPCNITTIATEKNLTNFLIIPKEKRVLLGKTLSFPYQADQIE